jgi:hypothetical protein
MPKKKTAGTNATKETGAEKKTRAAKPVASTTKPAAPAAKTATAAAKTANLSIDYPLEGEIVVSPVYTFRLTADKPQSVEVMIDGKEWQDCRESVGNWWFDWSGYQAGVYTLLARMTDKDGKVVKSKARQFTVLI